MKIALRSSAFALLGSVVLAAWSSACALQPCTSAQQKDASGTCVQIKSLSRFNGTPDTYQANWVSGGTVSVSAVNGNVSVSQGSGSIVSATYSPFAFLAYDTADADAKAEIEKLNKDFKADSPSAGSVSIGSSRASGASTGVGADMDVGLPPAFDGPLKVNVSNGKLDVGFVGSASSIDFYDDNGSCNVVTGSSATSIKVNCQNGQLGASVSGVAAGSQGGSFTTGNGDLTLAMPGTAKFSVEAQAAGGGTVDVGNAVAAGCTVVDGGSTSAQTVSCGGATSADPIFKATASGLGDVILSF